MGIKHASSAPGGTDASDVTKVRRTEWIADHIIDSVVGLAAGTTFGGYQVGKYFLTSGSVSAAATLDIVLTSWTAYQIIEIMLLQWIPATDGADLWMRTSFDAGSTFAAVAADYQHAYEENTLGTTPTTAVISNVSAQIVLAGTVNNAAGTGFAGIIDIPKQSASLRPVGVLETIYGDNAGDAIFNCGHGAWSRVATDDINAVRFMFSAGNITSGGYAVFGWA